MFERVLSTMREGATSAHAARNAPYRFFPGPGKAGRPETLGAHAAILTRSITELDCDKFSSSLYLSLIPTTYLGIWADKINANANSCLDQRPQTRLYLTVTFVQPHASKWWSCECTRHCLKLSLWLKENKRMNQAHFKLVLSRSYRTQQFPLRVAHLQTLNYLLQELQPSAQAPISDWCMVK